MIDEAVPRLVQCLPGTFVLALIAGAILFGWPGNCGQPKGGSETPLDGWLGDDSPHHHGGGACHGGG